MRTPSARCTPNTATFERATWPQDKAGGRVRTLGPESAGVRCSVQPSSALDVPTHLREEAVTYYTVIVHSDPQLEIRDLVTWDGRLLNVTGVLNSSGRSGSWKVLCEERT